MSEISFQLGMVSSVDATKRKAIVTSYTDQLNMEINLDVPQHRQYLPVPGQQVLLAKVMQSDVRIIAEFGNEAPGVQASKPLQPGEIMTQGSGGGFFYADRAGNAIISDKFLSNVIQFLVGTSVSIVGDALTIDIKNIGRLNIRPAADDSDDDTIEIIKTDDDGVEVSKVIMTNDKIDVEGPVVNLGPDVTGGVVVSNSGVPGTYSFDSLGRPVPGSLTVKGSS